MSRSEVNIKATYKFKFSPQTWSGVPIMSSNMDTVTNIETSTILAKHEWVSVFPKNFNQQWLDGELP
jgi:GMP reductase